MQRVGLVTGEYPPMEGGVGAFTQELARAMAEQGNQVHILTSREARPDGAQANWRELNVPVDIGFAQLHPRARRWRWWEVNLLADLVKRHNLDLVNIQYQAAAYNMRHPAINLAPWRLRGLVPTVVTFHDLRVPYLFPKAGPLRWVAVRTMAQAAAGVIVTNDADAARLQEQIDTPLATIPIGSNVRVHASSAAEIAACREELGVADDELLVGYFGFLNPSKGADTLVDAMASCPSNVHLVFIGGRTGDSDASTNRQFQLDLDARIASQGLENRIHWTGFRPDREVSALLNASDLMVMPYRDGVSFRRGTLMAILAHGRPLITTIPVDPTPELVHGVHCWLVPAADSTAVAEAIARLSASPAVSARLGVEAQALSRRFSWQAIAQQTTAFYDQVLAAD